MTRLLRDAGAIRPWRAAAAVLAACAVVAGCNAPGTSDIDGAASAPTSSEPADSTPGPDNAAPEVIEACPADDLVSVPPTAEPSGSGPDPRTITGPATAMLPDDDVHPVTDSAEPALPVTVRSCDGVEVEVTDVSRIVAVDLYGTLGEIVFSLGLGENVVGRDTSTGFPAAADVPIVTASGHDLNAEAILELDPTVVLTDASIGPPEVQQQLRDSGVPVIFFDDSRTLHGIPTHIRAVARALGVADEGEQLVDRVDAEIADAMGLAPAAAEPLRVTFLYIRGSAGVYLMAGPGSGADSLIQAIGAVDVGTDIGLTQPFTPLTSEALIEAAPEVIIMMTGGLDSVGGVDGLLEIPGVAQTPAAANRRIVDMDDTDLLSFGPRTGATIRALAEAIYQPQS